MPDPNTKRVKIDATQTENGVSGSTGTGTRTKNGGQFGKTQTGNVSGNAATTVTQTVNENTGSTGVSKKRPASSSSSESDTVSSKEKNNDTTPPTDTTTTTTTNTSKSSKTSTSASSSSTTASSSTTTTALSLQSHLDQLHTLSDESTGTSTIPINNLPDVTERLQREKGNCGRGGVSAVKFTTADIKELNNAGFTTVDSLGFASSKQLLTIRGISENKCDVLLKIGRILNPLKFTSAIDHLEVRKKLVRITTGSSSLDTILGGGLETNSITEVFGEFRSGKSQLCHTVAVTAQFPIDSGGNEGRVCYIDTEGCFRPERITQIANRYEVPSDDVLGNVVFCRAHTVEQLHHLLVEAAVLFAQSRFGLLIVDSVTSLYRSEYTGRGTLADRQQDLNKFLHHLQRLADEFSIAVLVTNQVQAKVDGSAMYGPSTGPIGGHILGHACQTRISMRKGKGEGRVCKVYDSPTMPESECGIVIREGGIEDE